MKSVSIKGHSEDVGKAKNFTDHLAMEERQSNQYGHDENQNSDGIHNDSTNSTDEYSNTSGAEEAHLNDSSDDNSDDDDSLVKRNTSDYQSKLEFAFKLGYGEADLIGALKNLGVNAGQNELLSELIKNSATRQEGRGVSGHDFSVSDYVEGSTDDIQGDQKKFYTGSDSSPFRHVIMDGSNVAMRYGQI